MTYTVKVKKEVHPIWKSCEYLKRTNKEYAKRSRKYNIFIVGKYVYRFSSKKGEISMITIPNDLYKKRIWEIYAGDNKKLFEDVERYNTKKQAEKRVMSLLRGVKK
jgi:hypothetical protein